MKMHQEMEGAMKRLRKMGGIKAMGAMMAKMGAGGMAGMLGGGMPQNLNKFNKR